MKYQFEVEEEITNCYECPLDESHYFCLISEIWHSEIKQFDLHEDKQPNCPLKKIP